jgi:hypothetical protein
MFEILSESTETCIGFKVSGKLTAEDYGLLIPKVDAAIAAHGTINMLVQIEGSVGWDSLQAAKADFKFGTDQYRHVERCAFVSDKNWFRWVVKLMDPFTRRTEEEFFEPSQLQDAWAWACGES